MFLSRRRLTLSQSLPEEHRWIAGLKALPHVRAQMRVLAGDASAAAEL